ncbi:MAG: hypothetical protein LBI79_05260 [Nitrososphaerota archaeon]|nr:hypothetical protein [Nitrososphaerota archaeon]
MVQKIKLWVLKALDRGTQSVVVWVLGHRNIAVFQRLYNKVKHLKNWVFYTDDWDAFTKVLPKECREFSRIGDRAFFHNFAAFNVFSRE